MKRITVLFLTVTMITTIGCSKKESLENYANIIAETDLREIISYSGIIEENVDKNRDGSSIHLGFGTEGFYSSSGREGNPIFIAHIEYLVTDEKTLINDMRENDSITGVGDYVWYSKTSKGHNYLIFYISKRNILVEIWGYNYDSSTFIDKKGLIKLAQLIEERL